MISSNAQTPAHSATISRLFYRIVVLSLLLLVPVLSASCNEYPVQLFPSAPLTQVVDEIQQSGDKKVDILFIVDNSQSMEEEQAKLKDNFRAFIEALTEAKNGVKDYQIGIVTTDADAPNESGKFQAKGKNPKILKSLSENITKDKLINYFVANVIVGALGSSYEKGLEAMQKALSPAMLKGHNKGFLREGAVLAVIFVADEDDCSHNGKVKEEQLSPSVCRIPQGGKAEDGSEGQMHNLVPTSQFVKFLKGLNRKVVVAGLIGNPEIRDSKKKLLPNEKGVCNFALNVIKDNSPRSTECTTSNETGRCDYNVTLKSYRCGGCLDTKDKNASAFAGYRYHEVITAMGSESNWFPICGDSNGFKNALLRFAGLILQTFDEVPLSKAPGAQETIIVRIVPKSGDAKELKEAPSTKIKCTKDGDCTQAKTKIDGSVCGPKLVCRGNGWVYFPPGAGRPARIKLSGTAKNEAKKDTKIRVAYISK